MMQMLSYQQQHWQQQQQQQHQEDKRELSYLLIYAMSVYSIGTEVKKDYCCYYYELLLFLLPYFRPQIALAS